MDEGLSLALITVHGLYSVVRVGSGNTSFSSEKDTVYVEHVLHEKDSVWEVG